MSPSDCSLVVYRSNWYIDFVEQLFKKFCKKNKNEKKKKKFCYFSFRGL